MVIFNHAQPALLWLVPSVLGSLWGTAVVRGELKLMWEFTEATEEETPETGDKDKDEKKDESKNTNKNTSIFGRDHEPKLQKAMANVIQEGESASEGEGEGKRTKSKKKVEKLEGTFRRDRENDLFFFSVGHYSPLNQAKSGKEKSPKWTTDDVEGERSGKRLRIG
jgi:minor histocompatibility antigen H13